MSIVKMQKVAIIGLDEHKESIMTRLMDFGAVELTDQKSKLADEELQSLVLADEAQEAAAELDLKINQAEAALSFLEKYDKAKAPLFKTRRAISKAAGDKIKARQQEAEADILEVLQLEEKLRDTKEQINKLEQDGIMLEPWKKYDQPLEAVETTKTITKLGVVPAAVDAKALVEEVDDIPGVVIKIVNQDKDLSYIGLMCLKSVGEQTFDLLKQRGFTEISFREFKGSVTENLTRIEKEKDVLQKKINEIENEVSLKASLRKSIEDYCDIMTIAADKEKIKSNFLKTEKTFYMEGWVPSRLVKDAEKILQDTGCYYAFSEPGEEDEVPVLLDNKNFFVPFESITEMYSLPAYKGFDPTSIYAAFYAIFFGMMLSDAGYGIIMTLACFIVLKKFNLEGTTFKMIKLFFYCGISTTVWGALFGGWFGDFVPVFARTILGKEVLIKPLWFNPLDDPMKLLIFSLALGVVHLFIGMGIKAYMQIKEGKWFDAICDEGFWYLTIIGLIGWLAGGMILPGLTKVGMYMAIIGMAGLLLTGGRHNKGFGKITGGLGNLYNITSYMSDILSYARLLALGLATGVIAQVVNTMGSLFGGGIVGLIILIVVFVAGHTLNLAINALGAFIHASRLQYVEFFGKFYEDGGEPFNPFRKKTKYIRIDQEEE